MTSATVDKIYDNVSQAGDTDFVFNADRDADGKIVEMVVSQQNPVYRYLYSYAADGMLTSRTKYVWHKQQWQCAGRYDYSLAAGLYTASYSRWNKKKACFDEPVGMIAYTLLPDESIASVACYSRQRSNADLHLKWQAPVESHTLNMDYYLTQK